MSSSALQRQLRRSLGPGIAERARAAAPNLDRYRRDPFAHLEDGHVLILGLALDETPDEDVVESEGGIRLAPQVFVPYEHEYEIAEAWIDLERLKKTGELVWINSLGEKSRQMGYTWTTGWLFLWGLMYHDVRSLAIHLNASKVDDGGERSTTESIFGRIRYMAESKIPASWDDERASTWPESTRPIEYLQFRQAPVSSITNRLTGATLIGGAATEDPGRGGSYTNVLADEFARVPWGGSVHRSLRSACPRGRMYGSTPKGKSNRFYELVSKPPRGYRKFRLHWSKHPIYGAGAHIAGALPEDCIRCAGVSAGVDWDPETTSHLAHRYPGKLTSPWYDAAVVDLTDEDVAQELDISYEASQTARVYPTFSEETHVADNIPYDPHLPLEFSFDYGFSPSMTSVGIWQDGPEALRKIGEVEVLERTPDQVAALIRDVLADLGVEELNREPRITRRMLAIGDPAGEARSPGTGRSIVHEYALQGFTILTLDPKRRGIRDTIRAMQRLLLGRPKPIRFSRAGCPRTILHMQEYRWPTDRSGTVKLDASEPVHDEHSHMCSADRYYVRWKYEPPRIEDVLGGATASGGTDGLPYRRLDEWEIAQQAGTGKLDEGISPTMRL